MIRSFTAVFVATLLVGGASPALAATTAEGDTLDLRSLIESALRSHPEVLRARSMQQAAAANIPSAGALENPTLELSLDDQPFDSSLSGVREIGVFQAIPFPGKRGARTNAAQRMSESAAASALAVERAVIADVKVAFWDLFELDSRAEILRESRRTAEEIVSAARSRYETGLGGQPDLLLAMVESTRLDGEIRHAEAVAAATRSRLNLLAGHDSEAPLGRAHAEAPTPFDASLEELLAWARENRPEVRAAERDVARAEADRRLAGVAARPDFTLGGAYRQLPESADLWRVSLALSLPVWKTRKEDAASREAGHRLDAARGTLDAERLRTETSVAEQFAHVVSEREIVELYRREILPQSELAYQSALAGYLVGRGTFLVLLEALRNHLQLREAYFDYFADAEMHLALLEEAVGRDLAPRGEMP